MKKAFRITTYAPPGDVDSIISSICSVWPVRYGKYENVFWLSPTGTEQFTPIVGSNPTQGMIGELETLESVATDQQAKRALWNALQLLFDI